MAKRTNPRANYFRTEITFDNGYARFSWGGRCYGPRFKSYAEAEKRLNEIHQATGLDARHSDERKL